MEDYWTPFTKAAVSAIKAIPPGKVASYGQIAAMAGSPRGARQVVRVLRSLSSKLDLPWHRVVGSSGRKGWVSVNIKEPIGAAEQKARLRDEGVELTDGGLISWEAYGWNPEQN